MLLFHYQVVINFIYFSLIFRYFSLFLIVFLLFSISIFIDFMADTFTNYPDYNFSISGITGSLSGANTEYYYAGVLTNRPIWKSLDGTYVVDFSSERWFITNTETDSTLFRSDASANYDVPWDEELVWTPLLDEEVAAGTPVLELIAFNTSDIVVSGIPLVEGVDLNGLYILGALHTGYPEIGNIGLYGERPVYFNLNGSEDPDDWSWIYWQTGEVERWAIYTPDNDRGTNEYISTSNVYYPVQASGWEPAGDIYTGTPVLAFASSEPEPEPEYGEPMIGIRTVRDQTRLRLLGYI